MGIMSVLILGYMYGFLWLRRNLLSMVWLFSTPFTILFLFYTIIGEKALPTAFVGSYLMIFVGAGVSVMGDIVWIKREIKLQDIFVASPLSALEYMAGIALAELFFSSPGIIILLIPLAIMSSSLIAIITIIVVSIVTWIIVSAISFYISTFVPNARNGWQISSILSLILTILPPIFYPIEVVPEILKPLAYLIPTTHSAQILKQCMNLVSLGFNEILMSWTYLILSLLFSIFLTVKMARWREI